MQIQAENFALLANVINQAKDIYIVTAKNPSEDILAAGLCLEENLSILGKKVLVVASGQIPENLRYFASKITSKVPAKKLVISFNWRKNEVEKVSYNIEGEDFNFIVNPRSKKINPEDVRINYQGGDPDLIITLGLSSLSEISGLEKDVLENKTIANIDKSDQNQNFGSLNFVQPEADSLSAVVCQVIEKAKLPLRKGTLDLLMLGMRSATSNFEKVADPGTFEAAAFCTRRHDMETKQVKKEPEQTSDAPKDWLSPKVFRAKQVTN